MSYIPTEWKTGDVVTAQKLNKIEAGISEGESGGSGLFIIKTSSSGIPTSQGTVTIDKTFNEIVEAYENGLTIVLDVGGGGGPSSYPVNRLPLTSMTINRSNNKPQIFYFESITSLYIENTSNVVYFAKDYCNIDSSGARGWKESVVVSQKTT